MKKCPYCGREYPDDTTVCLIDRESLPDNDPQLPLSGGPMVDALPDKDGPYLTFPDYQWSARGAWKCLGIILILDTVLFLVIDGVGSRIPVFNTWHGSGFGYFSTSVLHFAIYVLTAAYFARTETLAAFLKGFSLDRKPSNYAWFGVIMALIVRFFAHFMLINGWGKGVSNHKYIAFKHTLGFERYFFLLPALFLAPFFEELINRGFLYKAFRGSYPMGIGMALIAAWTAISHWPYYSHSLLAAFCLSMITIVQCYLREKSDSLWDCILCHFTFNASLLFFSAPLR
jgi:membrane protease YdiL (CAAX protease family)